MKAFVLSTLKQPLTPEQRPLPNPGPGQVRIRVVASGVCGTDIHILNGELPVPLPLVLGHEPVGVIDALGPGVTALKPSDRVGVSWFQGGCGRCAYCQKKQVQFCAEGKSWITNGGGYAEFMIAEADGCTLLPEAVPWEEAAPLFCGGFSAISAYRIAQPKAGERIAILGVGGLGHLALQVAKALGHEVIAVTATEQKRHEAKNLGADDVVVIDGHAGKELQARGGADVVLSFSPSMKQNSQILEGLRPRGRLVTTAVSREPIEADPVQMLFKQTSIIGSAHNDRADLADILGLVARRKVKPIVETYKLDDINRVLARLADGKVRYRAVLQVGA
jgi:D-arabinose 1-dehydrogenase-like Zn-dependent alcohol dehydrogenase